MALASYMATSSMALAMALASSMATSCMALAMALATVTSGHNVQIMAKVPLVTQTIVHNGTIGNVHSGQIQQAENSG